MTKNKQKMKREDDRRFKKAIEIIQKMSEAQARFALLLVALKKKGYIERPEVMKSFLQDLRRAVKARKGENTKNFSSNQL